MRRAFIAALFVAVMIALLAIAGDPPGYKACPSPDGLAWRHCP